MATKENRIITALEKTLDEVTPFLENANVLEIMLNPDGKIWVDDIDKERSAGKLINPRNLVKSGSKNKNSRNFKSKEKSDDYK